MGKCPFPFGIPDFLCPGLDRYQRFTIVSDDYPASQIILILQNEPDKHFVNGKQPDQLNCATKQSEVYSGDSGC